MNTNEARLILIEHNKWRRGRKPYDGDAPAPFPHPVADIGKAIDVITKSSESMQTALQIIHTWASVGKGEALTPASTLVICRRALEINK